MKVGFWLGYYYLGGGVQPLTGGCHQGGKWVVGRVDGDEPPREGLKDTLTLRGRRQAPPLTKPYEQGGERPDRCP